MVVAVEELRIAEEGEHHIAEEAERHIVAVHKVVEENLLIVSSSCQLLGIPTHELVAGHHIDLEEHRREVVDMPLYRGLVRVCESASLQVCESAKLLACSMKRQAGC